MSKMTPRHRISPHSKYTVKRCIVCGSDTYYYERISKVYKNDFECLCKGCNNKRQALYAIKKKLMKIEQLDGYADFGVSNKLLITVSYFVELELLCGSYLVSGDGSYYVGYDDVWSVMTGSFSTSSFEMVRLTDYEYSHLVGHIPELVMDRRLDHAKLCQSIVDVTIMSCPLISTIFVNAL